MNRFKQARTDVGLSQADVCRLLEIPRRTLQDWESGERVPPKYVETLYLEKLVTLKQTADQK